MKIFISSACCPERNLKSNLQYWVRNNIFCVELTGGINYEDGIEDKIIKYKNEFGIELQLHNYSPPPKDGFVLNIASFDQVTSNLSRSKVRQALKISQELGADKYAFHAGFYIPLRADELGTGIITKKLQDIELSKSKFVNFLIELESTTFNTAFYVENNVLNKDVHTNYKGSPLMLVNRNDYDELKGHFPSLKFLLDVGHLKVSCTSLNLNFKDELDYLIDKTDYLHISDNNGLFDENKGLKADSEMYRLLRNHDLSNKTVTLEVYNGLDNVLETIDLLKNI